MPLLVVLALLAALVPLVPGLDGPYYVEVLTTIAIVAYLSSSWNLIGGMTGQLSFAHGVFFGIGAYSSAALFARADVNPLAGGALGIVLAVAASAGIGYVSFRYGLSHLHFALATTAFAEITLFFASGISFIGGVSGLTLPVRAGPEQLKFEDPRLYYWIMLTMTAGVIGLTVWLADRALGLKMRSVRENEAVAAAIGINVMRTKMTAMMLSAGLTAAGGVIYAQYLRFLDPNSILGWTVTLQMIVIPAIIGGTTKILGPLAGAVIFVALQDGTRSILAFPGGSTLLVGVALVVAVLYFPEGVVGAVESIATGVGTPSRTTWLVRLMAVGGRASPLRDRRG